MSTQSVTDRQPGSFRGALRWVVRRWEVLIPVLGIFMFHGMMGSNDAKPQPWQTGVVIGMAIAYVAIVLWQPMRVPEKAPGSLDRAPAPLNRAGVIRAAKVVVPAVVAGVVVSTIIRAVEGRGSEGSTLWGLSSVVLVAVLGTFGLAAERRLPVDLLPVPRRREWLRIAYVLMAAFSLALVGQLWGGIAQDIAKGIGQQAFGETSLDVEGAASSFNVESPIRLLIGLLIGAGFFEELLFRLGILTLIWALTRRYSIGLIVSALLFGLYHITPLSGMSSYLATPITAVLTSAAMGVYMGLIYRYRGFVAAVLVHGLGDWIVIMMITSLRG
jgi:membrane protease YdiL (CAAX protease family)